MFKKTISGIGLAAFVALLLAGAASPASALVLAEKAFNRDGTIKTTAEQPLAGNLSPVVATIAEATYVDTIPELGTGVNDEVLDPVLTPTPPATGPIYEALFDIIVYDINNTDASNPSLFKNDLASISTNSPGGPTPEFGIANLRFTWYAGAFSVNAKIAGGESTDLLQSLVDQGYTGSDTNNNSGDFLTSGFFSASNILAQGCGTFPCAPGGAGLATWGITNGTGVLSNTSVFFNWMADGKATLLVTGDILEPAGGGYVNIITATAIPLPPAALLFGTALFGIGALRRWKDKKDMAVSA